MRLRGARLKACVCGMRLRTFCEDSLLIAGGVEAFPSGLYVFLSLRRGAGTRTKEVSQVMSGRLQAKVRAGSCARARCALALLMASQAWACAGTTGPPQCRLGRWKWCWLEKNRRREAQKEDTIQNALI